MLTDKQTAILEAASKAFLTYGFRKVTIGDIAEAAGMSRPSVYLAFENKEEIFRGVVELMCQQKLEMLATGLPEKQDLEAKLAFLLQAWVIDSYEAIHASNHGNELIESTFDCARGVMEAAYNEYEKAIHAVVTPYASELKDKGLTPERFAHLFRLAAQGFKEHVCDIAELRAVVADLVRVSLATLTR